MDVSGETTDMGRDATPADRRRWLARAASAQKLARVAAGLILMAGIGLAIGLRRSGVEWSVDALRDWVSGQPMAPLVFIGIYALRTFLGVPSVVMMAVGGALFGIAQGVLWGTVGATINAVIMFSLVRTLGRDMVATRLRGRLQQLDGYLRDNGAVWLALYTAIPVTLLSAAHLAAGLSSMGIRGFAVGTAVGLVPRTALFSFLGDSVASGDWRGIGIVLVVVTIASVVVFRLRRFRPRGAAAA